MKVLGICGSPREGSSERMLLEALKGCSKAGAQIELVLLRKNPLPGCCGKDSCFHSGYCDVLDGAEKLMEKVLRADALILASPSYFDNVSGLMKDFIDRTNPHCKPKRFAGKKVALLSVGGSGMRSVRKCEAILRAFCRMHGMNVTGSVCAQAEEAQDAAKDRKMLKECFGLGEKLAASR